MTIAIVESCSDIGAASCTFSVIICTFSILVFASSIYCIISVYKNNKKQFSFEIIPLLTCFLESLMHIIFNLFIMDIRILLLGMYFQTFTLTIVTVTFALLFYKTNTKCVNPVQKLHYVKIGSALYISYILVSLVLSFTGVTQISCDNWLSVDYWLVAAAQIIGILFCIFYGIRLLKNVKKQHEQTNESHIKITRNSLINNNNYITNSQVMPKIVSEGSHENVSEQINQQIQEPLLNNKFDINNNDSSNDLELDSLIVLQKQFYFKQRENQVKFIIYCFTSVFIAELTMNIIRYLAMETLIGCDGKFKLHFTELSAEIFIFLYSFFQLLPSFLVPYIFYYQPFMRSRNKQKKSDIFQLDLSKKESFTNVDMKQSVSSVGSNEFNFTVNFQKTQKLKQNNKLNSFQEDDEIYQKLKLNKKQKSSYSKLANKQSFDQSDFLKVISSKEDSSQDNISQNSKNYINNNLN